MPLISQGEFSLKATTFYFVGLSQVRRDCSRVKTILNRNRISKIRIFSPQYLHERPSIVLGGDVLRRSLDNRERDPMSCPRNPARLPPSPTSTHSYLGRREGQLATLRQIFLRCIGGNRLESAREWQL